jgi:hypothetical protein
MEAAEFVEDAVLSPSHTLLAMNEIFKTISRAIVRQGAGKRWENVGEVSFNGVEQIIEVSQISNLDCFVDIGAGIGNVIAHVALRCPVASCIGVEIRNEVATCGEEAMKRCSNRFPHLNRVRMIKSDIAHVKADDMKILKHATVLFCHNTVFNEQSKIVLHDLCCNLSRLRLLLMSQKARPRHRAGCRKKFCSIWRREPNPLQLEVMFRAKPWEFYLYHRVN